MIASSTTAPSASTPDAGQVYRGAGLYQPNPLFEVTVPRQEWQIDDSMLQYQPVAGCRLQLRGGGFGVPEAGTSGQASLGRYTWQTSTFAQSGLVSYALSLDQNYYLMHLYLPGAAADDTVRRCREAAEQVLASFKLLG